MAEAGTDDRVEDKLPPRKLLRPRLAIDAAIGLGSAYFLVRGRVDPLLILPLFLYSLWRARTWTVVLLANRGYVRTNSAAREARLWLMCPAAIGTIFAIWVFFFGNPHMTCGWGCVTYCDCASNLKCLGSAIQILCDEKELGDGNESYWPGFDDLLRENPMGGLLSLTCRESPEEEIGYVLAPRPGPEAPEWTPVAWCKSWHLYHRHVPTLSVRLPVLLKNGSVVSLCRLDDAEVYTGPARRRFFLYFLGIGRRDDPPRHEDIAASIEAWIAEGHKVEAYSSFAGRIPYIRAEERPTE